MTRLTLAAVFLLGLPVPGLSQSDTVQLKIRMAGVLAGTQVRLATNGRAVFFRFPGGGEVTLPIDRPSSDTLRVELSLQQRANVKMVDRWSSTIALNRSGTVEWQLFGTGATEVRQWAALLLEATEPVTVLVGGRRVGTTPIQHPLAPGGPWEILWRRGDGTTACVTDLNAEEGAEYSLRCDVAAGSVKRDPPKT